MPLRTPGTARSTRRPAVAAVLAAAVLATGACAGGETAHTALRAEQGPARPQSVSKVAAAAVTPAKRPPIPAGVTPGYMVFDTVTGKVTARYRAHARYRSASIVKILIALDYLQRRPKGAAIPKGDLALLRPMLRSSHDDAATVLWRRGGQGAIIKRMVRRLKLTHTAPPPADKPGFWGYTAISAADVVRTYRYLLERADPAHRDFILGNLRQATRCGADGFDQSFGIPSAVPRPWAVKQGWSGYGTRPPTRCARARANGLAVTPVAATGTAVAGASAAAAPGVDFSRPVLHTTGVVGKNDRFIVAVLTSQQRGGSWSTAVSRITTLTKGVYRAGGGK